MSETEPPIPAPDPEPLGAIDAHLQVVVGGGLAYAERREREEAETEDLKIQCDDKGNAVELTVIDEEKRTRVRAHRTRFIRAMKQTGSVTVAAQEAQISRQTAYNWRNAEPWFRQQWDDAEEQFIDLIEARGGQLAVEGVLEPIYHEGVVVGYVRKYSERMIEFMLKKRRQKTYGDKLAIDQRTASVSVKVDDAEAARLVAEALPMLRDVLGPGV